MPVIYLWGHDETTGEPVKCSVTAEGKLIINPTGFLENPPTEDEALKAPTSEWAFDHDADAAAHHAKYTDANSRAAINNIFGSDGKADKTINLDIHSLIGIVNGEYIDNFYTLAKCGTRYDGGNGIFYFLATSHLGVYRDITLKVYDGSAYQTLTRNDKFQAELDNYLENPPTEDSANTAPTSEWAFDHDADAAAHHAKYTDLEAAWSFHSLNAMLTTGTYTAEDMTDIHFLILNTTGGDITLKGLDNGQIGHIIFCIKTSSSNDVHIIHASGDAATGDKIYTCSEADESILVGSYGSFRLIHTGSMWLVDHTLP